jgi:tetratricopeptide (TPR) repeat protein
MPDKTENSSNLEQLLHEAELGWNQNLEQLAAELADHQDFTLEVTPLRPLALCRKKYMDSLINSYDFKSLGGVLLRAYLLIDKEIGKVIERDEEIQKIREELAQGWQKLQEKPESNPESETVETLQQIMGLSGKTLEQLYDLAEKLLEKNEWQDYGDLVLFLACINPHAAAYRVACGIFYEKMGNLEEALAYYEQARQLEPNSPYAYLYGAECYFHMDNKIQARWLCEQLLQLQINDAELSATMQARAQEILTNSS